MNDELRVVRMPIILFTKEQFQTNFDILNNLDDFRFAPGLATSLERKPLTTAQRIFLVDLIDSSPPDSQILRWVDPVDPNDPDRALLVEVPSERIDVAYKVFPVGEIPPLKDFKVEEDNKGDLNG